MYLQRDYLTQKASARSGQNSHILQGFFSHHKMVNISQNIDIKYIVKALVIGMFTMLVDHCNATDVNFLTVIFDLIFLFLYHNRAETKIVSL